MEAVTNSGRRRIKIKSVDTPRGNRKATPEQADWLMDRSDGLIPVIYTGGTFPGVATKVPKLSGVIGMATIEKIAFPEGKGW